MRKQTAQIAFSEKLNEELNALLQLLSVPQLADQIREDVLNERERRSLGDSRLSNGNIVQSFAKLRGFTLQRAVVDLAQILDLRSDIKHQRLRREIGEPIEAVVLLPVWDKSLRELRFEGHLIRTVSVGASSVIRILNCFEESGWPSQVDDPLPGGPNPTRLRKAIANLNRNLLTIKFSPAGGESIRWE